MSQLQHKIPDFTPVDFGPDGGTAVDLTDDSSFPALASPVASPVCKSGNKRAQVTSPLKEPRAAVDVESSPDDELQEGINEEPSPASALGGKNLFG